MITCKNIIDKFCDGPASQELSPEAIQDCRECTTLEDLIETLYHHVDFSSSAQAALFVVNYLDYEID